LEADALKQLKKESDSKLKRLASERI